MIKTYVKTTKGLIPLEDYLDIEAERYGFSNYEELKNEGYDIEISKSDIIKKRFLGKIGGNHINNYGQSDIVKTGNGDCGYYMFPNLCACKPGEYGGYEYCTNYNKSKCPFHKEK